MRRPLRCCCCGRRKPSDGGGPIVNASSDSSSSAAVAAAAPPESTRRRRCCCRRRTIFQPLLRVAAPAAPAALRDMGDSENERNNAYVTPKRIHSTRHQSTHHFRQHQQPAKEGRITVTTCKRQATTTRASSVCLSSRNFFATWKMLTDILRILLGLFVLNGYVGWTERNVEYCIVPYNHRQVRRLQYVQYILRLPHRSAKPASKHAVRQRQSSLFSTMPRPVLVLYWMLALLTRLLISLANY